MMASRGVELCTTLLIISPQLCSLSSLFNAARAVSSGEITFCCCCCRCSLLHVRMCVLPLHVHVRLFVCTLVVLCTRLINRSTDVLEENTHTNKHILMHTFVRSNMYPHIHALSHTPTYRERRRRITKTKTKRKNKMKRKKSVKENCGRYTSPKSTNTF